MQTKKTINIAVIGTGFMGKTHSYAISNLPFFYENLPFKAVLHTICSRSKQKGEQLKNEWGFLYSETSLEKILANKEIDVIDICTPNMEHFNAIMQALDAGKHIYCEKPLVISSKQADLVLEKLENVGRDDPGAPSTSPICAMVFHTRFAPAVQRAKQIINEGKLGEIMTFRCAFRHNSYTKPDKDGGWKRFAENGGGTLADLGSHAIDMVRFLCCQNNEITELSGKSQIYHKVKKFADGTLWRSEADEAFYITAKLQNGALGTIEVNKLAIGTNNDFFIEINGEKGALKYSLMQPNFLEFYDDTKPNGDYGGEKGFTKIECVGRFPSPGGGFPGGNNPVGWLRFHMHSAYMFLDGVYNNRLHDVSPTFYDGAMAQKIMEKAYLSDKTGQWEKV